MLLMICARSCTKALMPLVSAPLAVLYMLVVHFPVTLFDVVISIVIPISKKIFSPIGYLHYIAHLIKMLLPMLDFEYNERVKNWKQKFY